MKICEKFGRENESVVSNNFDNKIWMKQLSWYAKIWVWERKRTNNQKLEIKCVSNE